LELSERNFGGFWIQFLMDFLISQPIIINLILHPNQWFTLDYLQKVRRQGDPLSPYLFIILAEELGHFLKQSLFDGSIKGLYINPYTTPHSHLQFMDDTLLIGRPTMKESIAIKRILQFFMP